jgi:ubiquinone/menaquinone biosynthesis C-methylase UbiE
MEADVIEWLKWSGKVFLEEVGVKESQVVLDLGCRVGHYAIPAAKVVGEKGKVYAADNERASLDELMEIAKGEGLKNIVPMHTQSAELRIDLQDESVDVVLLYDVLHYMDAVERKRLYAESYRVLKNGALLSVYPKHHKSDEPLWNLSDMQLGDIIKEIEGAKFNFEGQFHKKLIHDDNFNMGYILGFTKK